MHQVSTSPCPTKNLARWRALQIRIDEGLGLNGHSSFAPTSTTLASDSNFFVGAIDRSQITSEATSKTQRIKFRHPPARLKTWKVGARFKSGWIRVWDCVVILPSRQRQQHSQAIQFFLSGRLTDHKSQVKHQVKRNASSFGIPLPD